MTIYERKGGVNIGPLQFGGKPGDVCEPYEKSVVKEIDGLERELRGSSWRFIMDVGVDEVDVLEFPLFEGESKRRDVVGPEINRDPLTRRYFIWKE